MKLLIIDISAEAQAKCAKRIETFHRSDMESLDLQVQLVGPADYISRVNEVDVLVLGAGLGEKAINIARQATSMVPWLHVIMFVNETAYGGGAFRAAHSAGVRKVFPDNATPLDFLQELVAIHAEFRRSGRTRDGIVIAVTHAKGGVGATTMAAGLAEVCSAFRRRTMIWDLDVETRDLSRGLTVNGAEAKVVSAWVNGSREVTRESLNDALIPISSDVSVLMPPDRMAESMDLVCHTDSINLVQRVMELARVLFEVVIVDTAGRMGPATGAVLRNADIVLTVIDDTVLGLTAVDLYLSYIKTLVADINRVRFLLNPYSGALLDMNQIVLALNEHNLPDKAWSLPPVPNDPKGSVWPGTGRTIYSMGQKDTRNTLEAIATELGLIN